MDAHRYRLCGLTVASCVELPGAVAVEEPIDPPDARIRCGPVPATLPDTIYRGPNWEAARHQVLLCAPGLVRFLIEDGREVWFEAAPGRDPAEAGIFLMGSVLGVLLHQRGSLVLHASAVAVGEEAVLFCGPSGAGKSVLAAALVAAGYPLVADELCSIEFEHGRPAVIPDSRRLKLWADAIAHLRFEHRKGSPIRRGFEKYWVEPPVAAAGATLPLRAVYFLHRQRLPDTAGIERVAFLDAVAMLRSNAYRRRLIKALGGEQSWLDRCATIARRAEAWNFTRLHQFDALPETIRVLEQHWAQ